MITRFDFSQSETILALAIALALTGVMLRVAVAMVRRRLMARYVPIDRRQSVRRTGNPVKVLIESECVSGTTVEGWVLDRSMGGLGLLVPHEFPVGARLSVRPANGKDVFTAVEMEVKNQREKDRGTIIGCQFTKQLQWGQLLMFG